MSYHSLSDYGLIGNQASAALVSRQGSLDWACLPYLDSPSHFGSLLDESEGGRFQICPVGDFRSEQRFLQRTHVLETLFETPYGRGILTDWMPMDPQASMDAVVYRTVEMLEGKITWSLNCAPRFYYGASPTQAEQSGSAILFRGGQPGEIARLNASHPLGISSDGGAATAKFELEGNARAQFIWSWGRRTRLPSLDVSTRATADAWHALAHRCPEEGCAFAGPWHDCIARACLSLRLLLTPYAGSIAESVAAFSPSVQVPNASMTSRYASIRESSFAIQALLALGLRAEAAAHFAWLTQVLLRDGCEGLQALYSLDGGALLHERDMGTLPSFQGARPMRFASSSTRRFQLDIYGHVLLAAHAYQQAFGELPAGLWPKLAEVAEFVAQAWKRPDFGNGDARTRAEHFVVSKALCWAALDRACQLAAALGHECPQKWVHERDIIHRTICQQGFDETRQSFVRAFGDPEIDGGTLMLPILGFLPTDDPRIQGTLNAVQTHLAEGVLLYRSRAEGTSPSDTTSTVLSLQFISCLALSGRVDEAMDRLAELCTYATPLGLLGEQINPRTGEMSGVFPSASVLLSLVNAGVYVGLARGKNFGLASTIGLTRPPAAQGAPSQSGRRPRMA